MLDICGVNAVNIVTTALSGSMQVRIGRRGHRPRPDDFEAWCISRWLSARSQAPFPPCDSPRWHPFARRRAVICRAARPPSSAEARCPTDHNGVNAATSKTGYPATTHTYLYACIPAVHLPKFGSARRSFRCTPPPRESKQRLAAGPIASRCAITSRSLHAAAPIISGPIAHLTACIPRAYHHCSAQSFQRGRDGIGHRKRQIGGGISTLPMRAPQDFLTLSPSLRQVTSARSTSLLVLGLGSVPLAISAWLDDGSAQSPVAGIDNLTPAMSSDCVPGTGEPRLARAVRYSA